MTDNRKPWDSLNIGDRVIHKSYGNGKVVAIEGHYVDVVFSEHRAKFYYPDAFERGFLSIDESPVVELNSESKTEEMAPNHITPENVQAIPEDSIDYIQIAQELFNKYHTMSQLDKHRTQYYQQYGEEAYKRIYKQVQLLRQEAMEIEAKYDPSNCYSESELRDFRIVDYMLRKAQDSNVRNLYGRLKGKYHSFVGILAACYPHQMENGRPAKLNKNSSTGTKEWQPYKRITYASIEKLYITCIDHFYDKEGADPIVEIHQEGEVALSLPNRPKINQRKSISIEDCIGIIEGAHDNLEMARDEEQDAYDNLPEGIQDSERGDTMQEYIDALDEAVSALDDVISSLQEAETESDMDSIPTDDSLNDGFNSDNIVLHKHFGQGTVLSNDGVYVTISFKHRIARIGLKDAQMSLSCN